jgi:hypothetical protein
MEAFMKTLVSVIALALVLGWPSAGEAQSKKSTARSAATSQQKPAQRVVAQRSATPCVRRVWWGCPGWDPDPNVRTMLARDIGGDD